MTNELVRAAAKAMRDQFGVDPDAKGFVVDWTEKLVRHALRAVFESEAAKQAIEHHFSMEGPFRYTGSTPPDVVAREALVALKQRCMQDDARPL